MKFEAVVLKMSVQLLSLPGGTWSSPFMGLEERAEPCMGATTAAACTRSRNLFADPKSSSVMFPEVIVCKAERLLRSGSGSL